MKRPKGSERWHPYTPAQSTDIRKTIERERKRLAAQAANIVRFRKEKQP